MANKYKRADKGDGAAKTDKSGKVKITIRLIGKETKGNLSKSMLLADGKVSTVYKDIEDALFPMDAK